MMLGTTSQNELVESKGLLGRLLWCERARAHEGAGRLTWRGDGEGDKGLNFEGQGRAAGC